MQVKQTSGKAYERRKTFGKGKDLIPLPDLVEVQRNSYQWFFQADTEPDRRSSQGLQELFDEIFPIESYDGSFALEFEDTTSIPCPSVWMRRAAGTLHGRDLCARRFVW